MLKELYRKYNNNKEAKNASWLIFGKAMQMSIAFIVSIFTTRYLGPSNYGIINYANAYIVFFTSLCTLGINSVLVKALLDYPESQGETLGTTLFLRGISSIFSVVIITAIVITVDKGETTTVIITLICSISLFFRTYDTFDYWYQSKYRSKISSIVGLIAYSSAAVFKIVLLIKRASVYWFAFANSIDYIIACFCMYFAYRASNGQKLSISISRAKKLLHKSYHYILSGLMVALYMQMDKFMLKQMLNETSVGYYSLASSINLIWVFVLQAIIDSAYPTIVQLYKRNTEEYERKNRQLYAIVIYVSLIVGIFFVVFGKPVIVLLYGESYAPAATPLKIITWYTIFAYLGVARNAWLVCENKQKYLKYIYGGAVILNALLNYLMIPLFGTSGAAAASLITQVFTSLILPCFFREMRPNVILMVQAFALKKIR